MQAQTTEQILLRLLQEKESALLGIADEARHRALPPWRDGDMDALRRQIAALNEAIRAVQERGP